MSWQDSAQLDSQRPRAPQPLPTSGWQAAAPTPGHGSKNSPIWASVPSAIPRPVIVMGCPARAESATTDAGLSAPLSAMAGVGRLRYVPSSTSGSVWPTSVPFPARSQNRQQMRFGPGSGLRVKMEAGENA